MLQIYALYVTPSNPRVSWNHHTTLSHSSKQDVLPVNREEKNTKQNSTIM